MENKRKIDRCVKTLAGTDLHRLKSPRVALAARYPWKSEGENEGGNSTRLEKL